MMEIFALRAHVNHYRNLVPDEEGIAERYRAFDGTPLPEDFPPLRVEPQEEAQPWSDLPGLASHIPVFGPRAVAALEDLLAGNGELLPLVCPTCPEPFRAFNVTRLVDALDVERSEVKRFRSGRIMRILRYHFHEERLEGLTLFKIREEPLKAAFVSRDFVRRVVEEGLLGFHFEWVFTTEEALLLCPYCWGLVEEGTHDCPSCGLDVTNDALIEMAPEEYREAERVRCPHCHSRILALADPCPHCGKGKRRQRVTARPVVVT
jgi:DNA-directed RNA polymerase subunit RPC12/RpoP